MAKKQFRADFRKNRDASQPRTDWTRKFHASEPDSLEMAREERVSGKGELSRKRTVRTSDSSSGDAELGSLLEVDESQCLVGRVLRVYGLSSEVEADDGRLFRCSTRRLLKTLSTDQRHVVAAGDRVLFRPAGLDEGIIERVEPRHGVLSRTSKGRRHVIVANVDQLIIVASVAEPTLKPNLIDRYLVCAEEVGLTPLICLNKVDLVDPANLQPIVGVYSQMGFRVVLASAATGRGIDRLRRALVDRQSVVTGQSGVGKSSLLNAVEPTLNLRTAAVSQESQKGRHTTTTARLIRLPSGGYVFDTPGLRQFALWDIIPEEVAALYRDIRPWINGCRYPNCTHTHEDDCAVKHAVADGWLDARRYESYCHLIQGDEG